MTYHFSAELTDPVNGSFLADVNFEADIDERGDVLGIFLVGTADRKLVRRELTADGAGPLDAVLYRMAEEHLLAHAPDICAKPQRDPHAQHRHTQKELL